MKIHFNCLLKLYLDGTATKQENDEFFEMVATGEFDNEIIKSIAYDIETITHQVSFKKIIESKILGIFKKLFKTNRKWLLADF